MKACDFEQFPVVSGGFPLWLREHARWVSPDTEARGGIARCDPGETRSSCLCALLATFERSHRTPRARQLDELVRNSLVNNKSNRSLIDRRVYGVVTNKDTAYVETLCSCRVRPPPSGYAVRSFYSSGLANLPDADGQSSECAALVRCSCEQCGRDLFVGTGLTSQRSADIGGLRRLLDRRRRVGPLGGDDRRYVFERRVGEQH